MGPSFLCGENAASSRTQAFLPAHSLLLSDQPAAQLHSGPPGWLPPVFPHPGGLWQLCCAWAMPLSSPVPWAPAATPWSHCWLASAHVLRIASERRGAAPLRSLKITFVKGEDWSLNKWMGGNSRVLTRRMAFKDRVNAHKRKQLLFRFWGVLQQGRSGTLGYPGHRVPLFKDTSVQGKTQIKHNSPENKTSCSFHWKKSEFSLLTEVW